MATHNHQIKRLMTSATKRANPWLCFTAEEDGSTIQLNDYGTPSGVLLEVSLDGKPWTDYSIGQTITLPLGGRVYMRAKTINLTFSLSTTDYYRFSMTGTIKASGNIMSLLQRDASGDAVPEFAFYDLFYNCSSLESAPELPATTLASSCYRMMFARCTSLVSAPELPATTLASYCYTSMFFRCTSLESAPELPATTLASSCYATMFQNCSSLNKVKVGFTSWQSGFNNWLDNVSNIGQFECPDELPDPSERGASTVPAGWTIVRPHQLYEAQENLVLQLDCKVGVGQDYRTYLWTTVDGQYTFRDLLDMSPGRDSKGGLAIRGDVFKISEVLPWLIEDGYTVEVCARQRIDSNDPTLKTARFAVGSGSTEETRENIGVYTVINNKQLEGVNFSSFACGGIFSANRVLKTFQQILNGELFTAYFHPSDNTCKLNGNDGVTIPFTEEPPYASQASTFVAGEGILYSVRVYNRALTASEQLHNRKLDIERFG